MGFSREILLAVLLVSVAAQLIGKAAAVTYVVGDSMGWTIPSSAGAYATYASQNVFVVGDVLVFNFTNGVHDVARVSSSGYSGCASTNPIALATISPATFTLNSTGQDYYICTFGQHCSLGQRLSINVVAASTSTPPTSTPAPPPSTMTPPPSMMTPPPSTMTPPPSMMTPPPSTMTPSSAPTPPPSSSMPPPTIAPSPSSTIPSMAPTTPMMSPSGAPGPTPMMTPSGAPGPAPGPSPGSGMTPPPSPMAPSSPGSSPAGPSADTGGPDGSGSIRATFGAPLAILASIVIGLVI